MKYDHLLVRYGELTLKGSNRKKFVNQLRNNVNKSLKGLDGFVVKGKRDRMYIELEDHADINEIHIDYQKFSVLNLLVQY